MSKKTSKALSEIDGLLGLIGSMLDKSLEERDRFAVKVKSAWQTFDAAEKQVNAELAELPGDLDLYLKLVRDRKRLEARRKALEAQAGVSHALNFHLGGGDDGEGGTYGESFASGGPTLMDELRAEEAELDRQAAEAEAAALEDEGAAGESGVEAPRRQRKGGRKGGRRDRAAAGAALRADPDEEAARERYNQRDGLFAHLEAAQREEEALAARCADLPEGSVGRLEAETELARVRARQAGQLAGFMQAYAPVRLARAQEEPLGGLGLALEHPADVVAAVEREALREAVAELAADEVGAGQVENQHSGARHTVLSVASLPRGKRARRLGGVLGPHPSIAPPSSSLPATPQYCDSGKTASPRALPLVAGKVRRQRGRRGRGLLGVSGRSSRPLPPGAGGPAGATRPRHPAAQAQPTQA